jgi:hypothetical protein
MVKRTGATTLGCLFTALVLGAGGYFGSKVAKVYWNHYTFQESMSQYARMAAVLTDAQIVSRLSAKADSLDLPAEAADVTVLRTGRHIAIQADYVQNVELPLHIRQFHFTPKAEHDF